MKTQLATIPVSSRRARRACRARFAQATFAVAIAAVLCGCTPWREYVHNGFKVGPNYGRPAAPVARDWIDANDVHVHREGEEPTYWWKLFNDPGLDALICTAYRQNLTLREAGFRVLEARAQLAIDQGNLFPQTQTFDANYRHSLASRQVGPLLSTAPRTSNLVNTNFNLAWELDFWGRFRRAIEADNALLDSSVENYDAALLTLLGDVATNYVNMRVAEQRIRYAVENVRVQRETLEIVAVQINQKGHSELDLDQARSTLHATEAAIPALESTLRQATNQLCILLGIPPEELRARLGQGKIPTAPSDVIVGIPADLLRRRPDVRAAERQLAAQSALIGVAEAEFYPAITINGSYGYSASKLSHLFEPTATTGTVGPSLQWNILNYGRILNGVRLQDARFQELLAAYQNSVLVANQDVENGLDLFLRSRERDILQAQAVDAARKAVEIATFRYAGGLTDFTTVTQVQIALVQQEDTLAQVEGQIALGLIQTYRALGGGWQIRLSGCNENLPPPGPMPARWQPQPEPIDKPMQNGVKPEPVPPLPTVPPTPMPNDVKPNPITPLPTIPPMLK